MRMRRPLLAISLAVAFGAAPAGAHEAGREQRLPVIGPSPPFTLTSQEGKPVSLASFRGKVVAVAFIYTHCPDICPLLTQKMAKVQDELGAAFGPKIAFLSITIDPKRDTPAVLKGYAEAFGANPGGWWFLTGKPQTIRDLTRRYGVFVDEKAGGEITHTLLTTIIDAQGMMRVQYIGWRFNPEEFRRDLMSLLPDPDAAR
jgi:protein SCO1